MIATLAACGGDAPPATSTPGATPTAPATAVAPSATASATPRAVETVTPSSEVVAQLEEVERFVERQRGAEIGPEVRRAFVTAAGMRVLLDGELSEPQTIELIREEELLLKALGLLAPSVDLLETYGGLLGSQVVGIYVPDDRALYVLADQRAGPLQLTTYAHELQHAVQDARFDLVALDEATKSNRDAYLAAGALIEGDATFTQALYIQQAIGLAGTLELLREGANTPPPNAPPVLLDLVQFPYLQGLNFVTALAREGGLSAVDGAFARLPASTEQVLHPEKYLAAEAPKAITRAFALPAGWSIESENVLGEFVLQRWLRESLSSQVAVDAAAGWGGDRYAVVRDASGQSALLAFLAWDSTADAEEFSEALFPGAPREGLQARFTEGGSALALARLDDTTHALMLAHDVPTLSGFARTLAIVTR